MSTAKADQMPENPILAMINDRLSLPYWTLNPQSLNSNDSGSRTAINVGNGASSMALMTM